MEQLLLCISPSVVAAFVTRLVLTRGLTWPTRNMLVVKNGVVHEGQFSTYQGKGEFYVRVCIPASIMRVRCADRGLTWAYNRGREAQAFRTVVVLAQTEDAEA
jgi:hypothetical protein